MRYPTGSHLEYFRPPSPPARRDEAGCVFVGAFDYRPNVDAACWFCREAWPEIHRRRPDARLRLVGRRPVAAVRRLAAVPGVEVVGQVPDVRPYLAAAAVAVNPLRIARGLQNKVLEAMAMGKAVVASPQALAGLRHRDDAPPLCARSAQEWIETVGRLLDQPEERRRLGAEGRRYVETHHDWDECLRPFESLLGLSADLAPGGSPVTRRRGGRRDGMDADGTPRPPRGITPCWRRRSRPSLFTAAWSRWTIGRSRGRRRRGVGPRSARGPVRVESRSDWAANILLFLPIGFFGMARPLRGPPPRRGLVGRAGGRRPASVFSVLLEFSSCISAAGVVARRRGGGIDRGGAGHSAVDGGGPAADPSDCGPLWAGTRSVRRRPPDW